MRDRETAQTKLEEIELEKNNLQELMVAIKVSHCNDPDCIIESVCVQEREGGGGEGKLTEWNSKLKELRLKELNYQKKISKLEGSLKYSQERVSVCERTISRLEEKIIMITKVRGEERECV